MRSGGAMSGLRAYKNETAATPVTAAAATAYFTTRSAFLMLPSVAFYVKTRIFPRNRLTAFALRSIAGGIVMAFRLFSNAFADGEWIPELHSCQGADVSPSLEWTGEPGETRSFALVVDDPD